MRCELCRDAISARLDGESLPSGTDDGAIEAHVAGCSACRAWTTGVTAQHRELRVRPADEVPDLTVQIMTAAPALRPASPVPSREWVRYALLTVALTQLVLGLPALVLGDDAGASIHVARELGSFDIALSVGWLWAAWQPRRAAGLLPMALALAAAMGITALLDVSRGTAPVLGEAHHVLDLTGVALLWFLNRPAQPDRRRTALFAS